MLTYRGCNNGDRHQSSAPYVGNTKSGTTRFGQGTRPGPTAINTSRRNLEFTSPQWGELCASNEATERNPREKVADGRLCCGNRPDHPFVYAPRFFAIVRKSYGPVAGSSRNSCTSRNSCMRFFSIITPCVPSPITTRRFGSALTSFGKRVCAM